MSHPALLSARQLSIGYRQGSSEKRVHENLTFDLFEGELTCLLGPNGAGKSTLLRTLAAAQPALLGSIQLRDRAINSYTERELSRIVGVVLTDKTFAGGLSVYELVALGRQPHTGFFGRLSAQDHKKIEESLEAVGIAHKAQNFTAELSDGERQKVMIAKALAQECPLILLDEPTAFLDVVSRIETMSLLHRLAPEKKISILLSTHDIEQALVLSDRLWLLSSTNGLQQGVTEDLILDGSLERLFERDSIHFDPLHGSYYPAVNHHREIHVSAADETLLHWTINALNRNGYNARISTGKEEPQQPQIVVKDATHIQIDTPTGILTLHSFAELTDYIRQS